MKYKYTRKEIADKWETTIKYSGNDLIRDLLAQKEDKKEYVKQLSDCCKAEIILTGKDRPNAFSCSKCGRIIGTPVTKSQTEGKKDVRKIIFRLFGKNSKEFLQDSKGYGLTLKEVQNVEDIDSWEISQFTGLYDFENKPIYEGDIVVNWVKNGTRSKTRWSNKRIIEFKDGSFGIRKGKCYQIVGNIYEKQI